MTSDEHMEKIREQAEYLRDMERMVASARMGLYRRVREAHADKASPTRIAEAAGWKTKKAVYDAIARWVEANEVAS